MHLREGDALVRHPVPVLIGQDEEAIVHLLEWLPLGIGPPGRGPEASPGVHRHLHRVDQLGKHFLVGEELDLHSLRHGELGEAFLAAVIALEIAFLPGVGAPALASHVGLHPDGGRDVAVVDLMLVVAHRGPDRHVPVCHHDIDHGKFVPEDILVALAIHELEPGATTPHVIPVCGAVTVVPVPVLVQHHLAHLLQARRGGNLPLQETAGDHLRHPAVPFRVKVDPIDGERDVGSPEELGRAREEIDEPFRFLGLRHFPGSRRIQGEAGIVGLAIRKVGIAQILVRDGREEHDLRRALPVGLHVAVVIHQLAQFIAILAESTFPTEGLVVTEHDEDHVGLEVLQVLVLGGEAPVAGTAPHRVTGVAEIPDAQVVLRIGGVENGLQPAIVLHTVRQATSDDADSVLLLESEGGSRGLRIRESD